MVDDASRLRGHRLYGLSPEVEARVNNGLHKLN